MSSTLLAPPVMTGAIAPLPQARGMRPAASREMLVWWLSALLLVSLAAMLFSGALEWEHYRRVLKSRALPMTWGDRAILGWLLWSKTVLPLAPVLLTAACLAATGCRRAANALLRIGVIAMFFWLAADLYLQGLTGNHVLDYLPYLHDAWSSSDRNHVEWAGDLRGILGRLLLMLGVVIGCTLLLARASHWLVSQGTEQRVWLRRPAMGLACTAIFAVATWAAVPAQAFFSRPLLLRRLHTALPVDLSLFVPGGSNPATFASLIGRSRTDDELEPGVRIASAVPDPAGDDPGHEEITLHNLADVSVSLAGWHLVNRAGVRHVLEGELAAGGARTLVLPAGGLEMNNEGDDLALVDAAGRERHRVTFKGENVKYGSVNVFREERDLDDFLFRVNQGVQAMYFAQRKDVLTPRPADDAARIAAHSPPHVVYLVLESFRESAVSPELLARLDAWGRGGLRMQRHYAPSNSSHWGIFTLLYGRSPLVYDSTVAEDIPPQTTHTLRQSGYDLTFVTSGDCTNFRQMDRFLNEERFDRLILENGADWRDWPQRDRVALFRVRDVLEKATRPQFVMAFLMSTHFPYAFSPEWDRHQPSGADAVNRDNWRSFDGQVLHNRYKNAALSLEEELMRLIGSLDPQKHVIVVTGDHGESMYEDGALAHCTRGSEVQTRVPLLMVGPGISPRVLHEPTTHTDVLPTLLHALAGRHVPLRHAHGRDVLSDAALTDQVLLCPYRWKDPYDLILVRGPERMQFKIRLDRAAIEAVGFCDTSGNLDLSPRHPSPRDALLWTEAFRRELARIAGSQVD